MPYLPIGDYGIIGNMRTAALIGKNGSVDWFCLPRFDSPSVFGAILDDRKGGRFQIAPTLPEFLAQQYYLPDTNVLLTRFVSSGGSVDITDFMPMHTASGCLLVRYVQCLRGSVPLEARCQPAFNYGRDRHKLEMIPRGAVFRTSALSLRLATNVPLEAKSSEIFAGVTMREGQSMTWLLQDVTPDEEGGELPGEAEVVSLLDDTVQFWRQWIAKCAYQGRWREMVHRSALTLELLVYEPTGAVVAAPTCSLPEKLGGGRNWDYRYSWMRDSAFTVYALLRIGLGDEADRFMSWIEFLCRETKRDGRLQTVYGIDGRRRLNEETLDHWEGYERSRPIRVGNAAYEQLQLDISGEVMDAVYLYNKYRNPISSDLWKDLRRLADWVAENWTRPDRGIWEMRGADRHFVYSKVMCWVALDRALRIAAQRSLPASRLHWTRTRDQIYLEILKRGWNNQRQAFVQAYKTTNLDAANLIMPLVFFMAPNDPRLLKTLEAILQPLSHGGLGADGMVCRYNTDETPDGVGGDEGAFTMCSFWLVEALTRASRARPAYLEKARRLFKQLMLNANHLGLFSEETGLAGQPLGNVPQALAHLAFISAAVNLDLALQARRTYSSPASDDE